MKHLRAKMKFLPLHYKLLMWFVFFSLIMMVFLWVFQTVFFRTFYKEVRVNQVQECSSSIEDNITSENVTTLVENLAEQNDVVIYVYETGSSLIKPLYSTDKSYMRVLFTQKEDSSTSNNRSDASEKSSNSQSNSQEKNSTEEDNNNIIIFNSNKLIKGNSPYTYYEKAKKDGGSYLMFTEEGQDREKQSLIKSFRGDTPPMDKLNTEGMIYTKLMEDSDNNQYMVIITSQISPVNSIVSTLRYQLVTITFVLIALGICIAIFASHKISKPITDTTKSAKRLANKDYDVEFNSTGYMEVNELNNTLNYAAKELKKVEALQHELIANISHDLRTPLTMITGYGEVMRDLPGENTPENIQIIIDEANRLNMLVTDLLDISKIQSGSTELNCEGFSITMLIKDMFLRYNKLKEQDGYSLTFEYDEEIFVNADQSKISQVIYNLVNNAINYSREDKRIVVRQLRKGDKVVIEVQDHGEGIDQEHLENIWDRYYKVDKEHKSSIIGTGLGLSIVKNILDLHNATYGVKSVVGEGSIFWFELKISED